jgi:hypothetical protein
MLPVVLHGGESRLGIAHLELPDLDSWCYFAPEHRLLRVVFRPLKPACGWASLDLRWAS